MIETDEKLANDSLSLASFLSMEEKLYVLCNILLFLSDYWILHF